MQARDLELRTTMEERERNYRAELALMERDIGRERSRADATVAQHREEAEEV